MKDQLGEKNMTEFLGVRPNTCSLLIDEDSEDKKAKGTRKICNKTKTQV